MSKIWDALQKVEENREDGPAEVVEGGSRKRLTAKQRAAVLALLDTDCLEDAASTAKVSERTLGKWLEQPDFVAAYYDATERRVAESMQRLRASTADAVEVLRRSLEDDDPMVRIGAASAILRSAGVAFPDGDEETQ